MWVAQFVSKPEIYQLRQKKKLVQPGITPEKKNRHPET